LGTQLAASILGLLIGTLLAPALATAVPKPRVILSVAPVPTVADPSPGTPVVTWSTGDGSPGLVTVSANGGRETPFAAEAEGSAAAPWLAPRQKYVFRLYATGSGHRLLAELDVGHSASTIVALPPHPRLTPPVVNRLLELLSLALVPAMAILAIMHAREVRRDA